MPLTKLIAQQLNHPSGIIGNLLIGPLWNRRNSALNDTAFSTLALCAQDRVLEVGFGGGYLLGRMSKVVTEGLLAGVDASMAMVSACQRRYRSLVQEGSLEVSCARAESLPYPAGHFTKLCSVNSIFYWQNAGKAIAEFSRVLADSGLLVLCFTCKASLATQGFTQHGLILYDSEEVQSMMGLAGFFNTQVVLSSDQHRDFLCMSGRKGPVQPLSCADRVLCTGIG